MATKPITPIVCRNCSAVGDLWEALDDADARRWVEELTRLPPVAIRPMMLYLKLHKPPKRALSYARLLTLTRELAAQINRGQVDRNGRAYGCPPERWAQAMRGLVDNPPKTLSLPLKGHGYLISILAGDAEKVEARDEADGIERKRHRSKDGPRDTGLKRVGDITPRDGAYPEPCQEQDRGPKKPRPKLKEILREA